MIPTPLWIVLLLSAAVIFVFMLFFADSAERAVVQATMMGGVAIVITSTLLLLWFLDTRSTPGSAASGPSRWSERHTSSPRRRRHQRSVSTSRATPEGYRSGEMVVRS